MTPARRSTPRRRSTLRPIGPAVAELVDTLRPAEHELVEIRLSPRAAAAIARLDARDGGAVLAHDAHPAHAAAAAPVVVDRTTAERWRALAWRAAGEGLIAPAEAQAVSDLLEPRGAA